MKNLAKVLILLAFGSLVVSQARASADPPSWEDVTASPFNAKTDCSTDAGPAINSAIKAVTTTNGLIFFPSGCYLISTQIIDNGTTAAMGLTYLASGPVELRMTSSLSSKSIIQFGDDTHTASFRNIQNIYFNCDEVSKSAAINMDGMTNSVFNNIIVNGCTLVGVTTNLNSGQNINNYTNQFIGGVIRQSSSTNSASGMFFGYDANGITLVGTHVAGNEVSGEGGIGVDFEGSGNTCSNCDLEGWYVNLWFGSTNYNAIHSGMEVSGGYFEGASGAQIRLGYSSGGSSSYQASGVSIHGAYINCTTSFSSAIGIQVDFATDFLIQGNVINNCAAKSVNILADSGSPQTQGGDNGVIGPNTLFSSAAYANAGKNNTTLTKGALSVSSYGTNANCSSKTSPAACGAAAAGSFAVPAGSTSVVVDTTAVTANSQILVNFDASLSTKLGVTCNTLVAQPSISARTAGTSFTVSLSGPPTNPACYSYLIVN